MCLTGTQPHNFGLSLPRPSEDNPRDPRIDPKDGDGSPMSSSYPKELLRKALRARAINFPITRILRMFRSGPLLPLLSRIPVVGEVRFKAGEGADLIMLSDGLDSVAASIFWGGLDAYEPGVFRVLAGCLSDLDATAVDVGANTGLFTLFLAGMGFKRVVAFEPVPEICARARRNVAVNGFRNADVLQVAVLDRCGDIRIEVPDVVPVPTSASVKGGFWDSNRPIVVSGTTLDAFFSDREDPSISFVKIDVEGAALEVLTGMRETIRRWNPVILCEVLPRDALPEIDALLAGCGYRAFCIAKEGTTPVDSFVGWRFGEWEINFLLVPPGRERPQTRDASR